MKKIFLILALMMSSFIYAQQNFQGQIIYRLHAAMSSKGDAELKIIFGDNKLKLLFKEKEEYEDDEVIVILDSAASYILNRDHKTFKKKLFTLNSPEKQIHKRTILGHSTTPEIPESNGLENLIGGYMKGAKVIYYLADSLFYAIPAIFEGNAEVIAIHKNKIVLAAEIEMRSPYAEPGDTSSKADIITAEAIEIKPMKINDDEFSIPATYVDITNTTYDSVVDSIAPSLTVPADTAFPMRQAKKKPIQKPVKPNKPKTTVKSEASRRKE
ncbi:MAG: hypothetical protein ABI741_08795 [Ferruginibacter sp.]